MMLTQLMYSYATGQRSSRTIERRCRQDVTDRVITGNLSVITPTVVGLSCGMRRRCRSCSAGAEVACSGRAREARDSRGRCHAAGEDARRAANREFEQVARGAS